jgi:ketosteroid isomerase-like protein
MSTTEQQIRDLGHDWIGAEQRADVAYLDTFATDDFTLVGPLGFLLDKRQWLERYTTGAFVTRSLTWTDVSVRDYGDAAVAVGALEQEAAYQGRPSNGRFRVTQILVRDGERWRLAGLHYSPIAPPPGPPPGAAGRTA